MFLVPHSRTTPSRVPETVNSTDRPELNRLLGEVAVGHFAFVFDDRPVVMPIAFTADGDSLLLHGSTGSWWLRQLSAGIPVTAAITAVDGLVFARSAFESSMHYRSAVLFGSCSALENDAKLAALERLTNDLLPGRSSEVREHSKKELAATLVLRMRVDEWTIKVSHDWPEDLPEDVAGDTWAGVLPIVTSYGSALSAPDLLDGVPLAPSVARLEGMKRSGD